MSRLLLVKTETDASVFGDIVTSFVTLQSGVLAILSCLSPVMVSAFDSFCNTASWSDGGVYSEIILIKRDWMGIIRLPKVNILRWNHLS